MNLSKLAQAPQLVKVEISDEDTVKQYGEAVVFYTWDRIPAAKFIQMAGMFKGRDADELTDADFEALDTVGPIIDLMTEMVLDEQGQRIFTDGATVEPVLLMKIVTAMTERLGKSQTLS
jgi:L-alanine-DL-glutamate epimerase-like enolase superfamily enzyme